MGKGQGVWGGVKSSPPIYKRTMEYWEPGIGTQTVFGHEYGEFHSAGPSKMQHISWAIYRIRRARVGQASLFDNKRRKPHKSKRNVTFWGWGVPSPKRKKAKNQ